MRCPHWDCGWCFIDKMVSKEYKIEHQKQSGCCGSDNCPWYKENIEERTMKEPLPDYMKALFDGLADKPLPPREGASIGELVQNMEHNIKVMKK